MIKVKRITKIELILPVKGPPIYGILIEITRFVKWRSVREPQSSDFDIRVQGGDKPVIVKVINQFARPLTKEMIIAMTPEDGLLKADIEGDILKVALIDRTNNTEKMFGRV